MNTVAIIQARMGSSRLPGKILKPLGKFTVLEHVINRVSKAKCIQNVIIATTVKPEDDITFNLCSTLGINCIRGSEEDVLDRYIQASNEYSAEIIVRVTADCPFISPEVIDLVINMRNQSSADYTSNTLERTFPHGLDVECFTYSALQYAHQNASLVYEREHVTPYFYNHPELFSLSSYVEQKNFSNFRLTLDTQADYNLMKCIVNLSIDLINPKTPWQKVVRLLESSKKLTELHEIAKNYATSSRYETCANYFIV